MWGRREKCVLWPEVNPQFISTRLLNRKNFTYKVIKRNIRLQHTSVCYMSVQVEVVSCTSFSGYAEVVRPNEKSRLHRGAKKFYNSKSGHQDINADKCFFFSQ
jgi:hypothetical protein